MLSNWSTVALSLFPWLILPGPVKDEAKLFLVRLTGQDVSIEPMVIAAGETKTIKLGGDSKYIDVIYPPAPGGSASVAQTSMTRTIRATNVAGALELKEEGKGSTRDFPRLIKSHDYSTRVSIASHDGKLHAFVIRRFEEVIPDDIGPVIDLFAGKIPLNNGDFVIGTDTYLVAAEKKAKGSAPIAYDRWLFIKGRLPNGSEGDFILDVGAGQSLMAKKFVPAGATMSPLNMVEYSGAGKKFLPYAPAGATGAIDTIVGEVELDATFGTIDLDDMSFAVVSDLPDVFGRPIVGILGIDALRRANNVSISLQDGSGTTGSLKLADHLPKHEGKSVVWPFSTVSTHLMVRGTVNEKPVSFVIDTGAPDSFLDLQAAKASSLNLAEQSSAETRGLDSGSAKRFTTTAEKMCLGTWCSTEQRLQVSPLPVFASMRTHNQSIGLIGNSILSRFERVDIDFERCEISLLNPR